MKADAEMALQAIMKNDEVWEIVRLVGKTISDHGNVPEALSAVLYAVVRLEFGDELLPYHIAHNVLDDILAVRDAIIVAHNIQDSHEWELDDVGMVCKGCGLRKKKKEGKWEN